MMPLLTMLLAWTNNGHGLIWSDTRLDTRGSFSMLYLAYGPLFWVWVIYSYSLVLLGSLLFLQMLVRLTHLYRRQAVALLIDRLFPLATVITPNLHETEFLVRRRLTNPEDLRVAAIDLLEMGAQSIVIKGGHLENPTGSDDLFYDGNNFHLLKGKQPLARSLPDS